jgi:fatty acid desaturase
VFIYLAIGAAILWFLVGLGRGQTVFKRREWRIFSGALSVAAFAGAAFAGLRGAWEISIILVILGLWTVTSARINAVRAPTPPPAGKMTEAEARSLLGVDADATDEDIEAAYRRLMRMAHPDTGGTTGLARQLNAARDRLLGS